MEQQLRMEKRFLEEQAGEREVRHFTAYWQNQELLDHVWENIEPRAALRYWFKRSFESNFYTHLMCEQYLFCIVRINTV